MNMLRMTGLFFLLAAVGLAGGCSKDVTLTFSNTTPVSRAVEVTIPGEGTESFGVVGPGGGQLVQKISIKNEDLPATVSFRGGDQSGQFTVNENSSDKIWIDFTPNGAQVRTSKKTSVVQKTETKTGPVVIHQDTVVE